MTGKRFQEPEALPSATLADEPEPLPTDRAGVSPQPRSPPGYEIFDELGRGGMGVVYRARQTKLNRLVALKVMLAGADAGPQELIRFRTEAEAVARSQHPNIVQVFEIGDYQGRPFLALELVEGGSLADRLDGTPLTPRQAAELVQTLARAVHVVHERGVVHRDLKPANVLLTGDGTPKVTDFGLAKFLDTEAGQTRSGAILGTPSYMAPEQAAGGSKGVGRATDVYALGAILYELLTGRPPFRAATPLDTLLQVLSDEPVAPRRLQPKVPADLETVCLKCLEKKPGRRYASAEAFADELGRFLRGEPVRVRRPSVLTLTWNWLRRPERMRDAGLIQLWLAASAPLSALLVFVDPAKRPSAGMWATGMWAVAGIWLAVGSISIWVGLRTIARELWAIWSGLALSLLYLAITVSGRLPRTLDGSWLRDDLVRSLYLGLLPVLIHGVALFAHHVNRVAEGDKSASALPGPGRARGKRPN